MKIVKLSKSDLKDTVRILKKCGAVNLERNRAFPSHVYVSPYSYKTLEKNLRILAKKQRRYATKRLLDNLVGMELLNLGPVVLKGLPDNVALVDNEAIKLDMEIEDGK
jgi:hypothetical protein